MTATTPGSASGSLPAVRDADPHRCGLGKTERYHEGDRGQLQRYAVCRQFDRSDPAHQQRCNGKQADFGKNRDADRQAEHQHFAEACQSGRQKRTNKLIGARSGTGWI